MRKLWRTLFLSEGRRTSLVAACALCAFLLLSSMPGSAQRLAAPEWARSVEVVRTGATVRALPSNRAARRGTVQVGTRLPFLGRVMGQGCPGGQWVQIGAERFICETLTRLSPGQPAGDPLPRLAPGALTPREYAFVSTDGAWAYGRPADYFRDVWVETLGRGFGVAIVERTTVDGVAFARTLSNLWIPVADLHFSRPSDFQGVALEEGQDLTRLAWVVRDRAPLLASARGRRVGRATELQRLTVVGESRNGRSLELSDGRFIAAAHVARPRAATVPEEVSEGERWIDVDTQNQILTAYVGERPVFVTPVSTGRPRTPTHRGVFRIWVKLAEDNMDDLEREDVEHNYAIEAVPWVQYFDGSIALHATFWHHRFGRVRSHGCVNLAPQDAHWLFEFTQPGLPPGWDAILPTERAQGTVIRVR